MVNTILDTFGLQVNTTILCLCPKTKKMGQVIHFRTTPTHARIRFVQMIAPQQHLFDLVCFQTITVTHCSYNVLHEDSNMETDQIQVNNKLDLYSAVYKRLAVDLGTPSQCFLTKNITSKGLMSIASKVVVQMNTKLGEEPSIIKLPLTNIMFVGLDVYYGSKGCKEGNLGAMVNTLSHQACIQNCKLLIDQLLFVYMSILSCSVNIIVPWVPVSISRFFKSRIKCKTFSKSHIVKYTGVLLRCG